MPNKLTAKQEMFVQEYLVDLNATQAAIRAGYSEKTAALIGCENIRKPNIASAIVKAKAERVEKVKIDAAYVLRQAVKLHERCMQEVPVLDHNGKESGEYKFEHTGAAKGLDIIGKHVDIKAFDNSRVLKGDPENPIEMTLNPSDKLRDFLNDQSKRIGNVGDTAGD